MANEKLPHEPEDRDEGNSQGSEPQNSYNELPEVLKARDSFRDRQNDSSPNLESPEWEYILSGKTPESKAEEKRREIADSDDEYWEEMNIRSGGRSYYDDEPLEPAFTDIRDTEEDYDFMKDPTDFTDVAGSANKQRNIKIIVASTVAILVIGLGGVLGLNAYINGQASTDEPTAESTQDVSPESAVAPDAPSRPLLDAFPNAPEVTAGGVTTMVNENSIITSTSKYLSIKNVEIVGAQIECVVTQPTDFCLSARTLDTAKQEMDIYFLKDAAHSRMFENPSNFRTVDVPGATTAGVMEIALIGGKPTPIIVVVNSDSSGFMIALPNATLDEAASIATSLIVS